MRLLDACLGADMLVCAAHQVRSLLRHPDAHLKSSQAWRCDGLASARVFGERAEAVRWCPHGQACRAVTNATADAAVAAGPMAALDGGLWRGENFVSVLKELLASEREWKGGSAQQQHNHATMQQMQGTGEIARKLYAKVLAPWSSPELAPSVDVLAHAYGNLAQLERGAAARRQLEAALSLLPAGESAAVWWREVAAVHAVGAKTSLARHAARKAIKLRPDSAFAHALSGELDLTRHEWGKAHDGFARADALQAASAPEMPPCARWSSIAPRLERAQWWGGRAPATALPAARRADAAPATRPRAPPRPSTENCCSVAATITSRPSAAASAPRAAPPARRCRCRLTTVPSMRCTGARRRWRRRRRGRRFGASSARRDSSRWRLGCRTRRSRLRPSTPRRATRTTRRTCTTSWRSASRRPRWSCR